MTERTREVESFKKAQRVLRWIVVAVKLLVMLILLIVFLPFILLWFIYREYTFKSSLKRGMRKAGADEDAIRELSDAFPKLRNMIRTMNK